MYLKGQRDGSSFKGKKINFVSVFLGYRSVTAELLGVRSAKKRCEINRGNDILITAFTLACLVKIRCLLFRMFSVYRSLCNKTVNRCLVIEVYVVIRIWTNSISRKQIDAWSANTTLVIVNSKKNLQIGYFNCCTVSLSFWFWTLFPITAKLFTQYVWADTTASVPKWVRNN